MQVHVRSAEIWNLKFPDFKFDIVCLFTCNINRRTTLFIPPALELYNSNIIEPSTEL